MKGVKMSCLISLNIPGKFGELIKHNGSVPDMFEEAYIFPGHDLRNASNQARDFGTKQLRRDIGNAYCTECCLNGVALCAAGHAPHKRSALDARYLPDSRSLCPSLIGLLDQIISLCLPVSACLSACLFAGLHVWIRLLACICLSTCDCAHPHGNQSSMSSCECGR